MRQTIRGWRSARAANGSVAAPSAVPEAVSPSAMPVAFPFVAQQPIRFGIGLVALSFYMWLIHSYKLSGGGDIAVAVLIIGVFVRGGTLRVPALLKFFLLFILWNALGLTVTSDLTITTDVIIGLAKLWIITFCLVNTVRTAAERTNTGGSRSRSSRNQTPPSPTAPSQMWPASNSSHFCRAPSNRPTATNGHRQIARSQR